MRVVHDPDGAARELATDVETADTALEQARGLMFRSSLPEGYALAFRFDDPPWWTLDALGELRAVHMLFVRTPLDVLWLRDGAVVHRKRLAPWLGAGVARADTVVELPAGAADGVAVGDEVAILDGE